MIMQEEDVHVYNYSSLVYLSAGKDPFGGKIRK